MTKRSMTCCLSCAKCIGIDPDGKLYCGAIILNALHHLDHEILCSDEFIHVTDTISCRYIAPSNSFILAVPTIETYNDLNYVDIDDNVRLYCTGKAMRQISLHIKALTESRKVILSPSTFGEDVIQEKLPILGLRIKNTENTSLTFREKVVETVYQVVDSEYLPASSTSTITGELILLGTKSTRINFYLSNCINNTALFSGYTKHLLAAVTYRNLHNSKGFWGARCSLGGIV